MSLLSRFLGGGRNKAYADGVAHLEAGRFAAAVEELRRVALGDSDTPSGSLASFQFRQALLREGRRLLRTADKGAAIPYFAEAAGLWDQYPDLHALLGAAHGLSGDWGTALAEAQVALRLNPDYAEARLLEAVALARQDRPRHAAESLNKLVESGRRVDHWLIAGLAEAGPFSANTLPEDLTSLLERSLGGESEKEEVASAVALCRAGQWDEGLERFAALVERRPRYPDYRTRHAAALFQVGRNDEALAEVEAALALNERYHTAIDLKGLILADQGQLSTAASFLAEADTARQDDPPATTHEALFGAYLRGVLALLGGRPDAVRTLLGPWSDLVHTFARAELLLAAADDLAGRREVCTRRLVTLVEEWSAEPVYHYLLACRHLAEGRHQDVAAVLSRWPAGDGADADLRPLYLESLAAVAQGRVPAVPELAEEASGTGIAAEAWQLVMARSEFVQGADARCWEACAALDAEGHASEGLLALQVGAAVGAGAAVPAEWRPGTVLPDSCLPAAVQHLVTGNDAEAAARLVAGHARLHPEQLQVYWLDAEFWLGPVRGWVA